ncbi:ribosomal protein s18 domain-containing protein [Sarocladium implicatum]|nr:ribosomal protein s18 domain-containing protein [Sarocladium implicatum]
MPPSLSIPSALRSLTSSTTSTTTRLFSSSTTLAAPPRHTTPSATDRLTTIMKDRSPQSSSSSTSSGHNSPRLSGSDIASRMLARRRAQSLMEQKRQADSAERVKENKIAKDLLKQLPRKWKAGEIYAPHDLSPNEMQKWKKRSPAQGDLVDALNLSPTDMYKNFSIIRAFTSSGGQILHSSQTKLRPVNQRKVAKMIRRAQGMGLYPSIHAHPETLRRDFFPNSRF